LRLHSIKIREFKNLQNFEAEFDSDSLTTVILGQNATGKSNLLEALVIIFRDLDLGELPAFEYEIQYECRGHKTVVTSLKRDNEKLLQITYGGESISLSAWKNGYKQFLPSNVFGYYSGPSNRFESHFLRHQQKFYRQLLDNAPGQAIRPLFYARLIHSQFVLLAFFFEEENEQITKFLKEYLNILSLESVLFVLQEPSWKRKTSDPRFWGARGAVQGFLEHLYKDSTAPLKLKQRINLGLSKSSVQERLYLFLRDAQTLREFRKHYLTPSEFFKALESTYISELLAEVRIRVHIQNFDGSLTFRELSEGEQQLLTVLGLLRFTRDEEVLFLLDEPDTHLNPVWSLRYLELLREVVGEQKTSQIILTTHDPLTIAGLTKKEVRVMFKNESGQISAKIPEHDPKGMGASGILTSELFGLRSDLDLETLKLLDEKRDLSIKDELTGEEKNRLAELRDQLKDVDMSARARDPLYRDFIRALWAKGEFNEARDIALTPEQQEMRQQLALQAIAEVEAEKKSK
jgi:predicted ATPase